MGVFFICSWKETTSGAGRISGSIIKLRDDWIIRGYIILDHPPPADASMAPRGVLAIKGGAFFLLKSDPPKMKNCLSHP
jgi:hypothetical protein